MHRPLRETLRDALLQRTSPPRAGTLDTRIDPELADVLRALTFLGEWATAAQIAALVDRSPLRVLLSLQRGVDQGLRIEEDGEHFRVRMVSSKPVLQGLSRAWAPRSVPDTKPGPADSIVEQAPLPVAHLEPVPEPEPPAKPEPALSAHTLPIDSANAARQAFLHGDVEAALTRAATALAALNEPIDEEGRQLRLQLLSDSAIYLSRSGDPLALQKALATASQAVEELQPTDPPTLRAAARIALAGVATEEGSAPAIDRAIDELTQASRELSAADRGVDAARLLNDLAELWMRRGDPVRATHLLRKSRQAFAAHAEQDVTAAIELAETEHVLSRLAFHARAQPGVGESLWSAAADHAQAAIQGYQQLGMPREEGRAWESMGRIQLETTDLQGASESLRRAANLNQQSLDRVGLARTSLSHARLFRMAEQPENALTVLEESLLLNLHTGSTAGVRYCAEELERLRPHLPADPGVQERVRAVEQRVAELTGLLR